MIDSNTKYKARNMFEQRDFIDWAKSEGHDISKLIRIPIEKQRKYPVYFFVYDSGNITMSTSTQVFDEHGFEERTISQDSKDYDKLFDEVDTLNNRVNELNDRVKSMEKSIDILNQFVAEILNKGSR